VKGSEHPLNLYRRMGVPVALSTDDQGILRTDMTNEYVRAVREQGLDYGALKRIARDSLDYSFLPGASLWKDRLGAMPVDACARRGDAACRSFIASSEKARLELAQEEAFDRFEAGLPDRFARVISVTGDGRAMQMATHDN
jgi:adenosine deaminase